MAKYMMKKKDIEKILYDIKTSDFDGDDYFSRVGKNVLRVMFRMRTKKFIESQKHFSKKKLSFFLIELYDVYLDSLFELAKEHRKDKIELLEKILDNRVN